MTDPWFCHPDRCPVCHGTDWDAQHDVPCRNRSFCVAVLERDGGQYVCGQDRDHSGPHRSGAVTWDDVSESLTDYERRILADLFDAIRDAPRWYHYDVLGAVLRHQGSSRWVACVSRLLDAELNGRLAEECAVMHEELR